MIEVTYEIPTDSASVTYGPNLSPPVDVYSLCGPRSHYLTTTLDGRTLLLGLQTTKQRLQAKNFLEFEYLPNGDPYDENPPANPIPVFQIRVNSTDMADEGPHQMVLHFEFDDYPDSDANDNEWYLDLQIEYCLVESFVAPADFVVEFVVGHKPSTVEYVYS